MPDFGSSPNHAANVTPNHDADINTSQARLADQRSRIFGLEKSDETLRDKTSRENTSPDITSRDHRDPKTRSVRPAFPEKIKDRREAFNSTSASAYASSSAFAFASSSSSSASASFPSAASSASASAVDYVNASTVDGSPLAVDRVESYFTHFGPLDWCSGVAGSASAVIFRFRDPSLFKSVLDFHHYIEKRPVRLVAVMEKPAGNTTTTTTTTTTTEPYRSGGSWALPPAAPPAEEGDDASFVDLAMVMRDIDKLAGSVKG